jgi:hypothetical protein
LKYWFHGRRLTIGFDKEGYSVGDSGFVVRCNRDFGVRTQHGQLDYFEGKDTAVSLEAYTDGSLALKIGEWDDSVREWRQTLSGYTDHPLIYAVCKLKPNAAYTIFYDQQAVDTGETDAKGQLMLVDSKAVKEIIIKRRGL